MNYQYQKQSAIDVSRGLNLLSEINQRKANTVKSQLYMESKNKQTKS